MQQTPNITISGKESRSRRRLTGRVRLVRAVLGLALLSIDLGSAFASPFFTEPPSTLSVTMHNQQFSAQIIRAPLEKVLATLTSYIPIKFYITGNAKNDLVSASFTNVPLETALEHLLNGYDYAILLRRIEGTPLTSQILYRTKVEIISRNPTEPSSTSNAAYAVSSQRTSIQPTLVQANQIHEIPQQEKPLGLGTTNDASDFQTIKEEVFQDDNTETRTLAQELMQELVTTSE
ncbi:MAG TPA: hypothetical protein PKK23_17425 [Nitrospirales bacterium]|nr:hypothetical protein [Nitrospiraceae bacterium]HNP30829.1 hypothetical protein [Nitrospirales bacterium]